MYKITADVKSTMDKVYKLMNDIYTVTYKDTKSSIYFK